jgi:hypothetical protein
MKIGIQRFYAGLFFGVLASPFHKEPAPYLIWGKGEMFAVDIIWFVIALTLIISRGGERKLG